LIPLKDDNPTRGFAVITVALIGACIAVFLWQVSLGDRAGQLAVYRFGVVPGALLDYLARPPELHAVPDWATVFTSMFLHGGWMHLIGNMLYLWIFGDNVEDAMGGVRFLAFYLICGIAAVAAQALPAPTSAVPMIGASGAISGVLGAYLLLHPRAHVLVLIPLGLFSQIIRLPAMLVLGLWFGLQLLSEIIAGEGSGVAFRAHIGGFVAGMALVHLFRRR
jgi:membrane associated rhomboid family serine protease